MLLIEEKLRCGVAPQVLSDLRLMLTMPELDSTYPNEPYWEVTYTISGLFEITHTANSTSKLEALTGALMGMRAFLRERLDSEGLKLYVQHNADGSFEEVDFDGFFNIEDCVPEDYAYVVEVARKKGISLD